MTIGLVTDSTCYLSPQRRDELAVQVVPLHVTLGDWSFDEPSVPPVEFYRRWRESGGIPKTSQPAPGEFLAAFERVAAAGADAVLCLTCTATMSGTHQSAALAAEMASLPVVVLDSGTISGGLLLVVGEVARSIQAGADLAAVAAQAQALAGRVCSTWSSDTSALLAAGGRFPDEVPDGVAVLGLEGSISLLGSARSVEESVALQADRILAAASRCPTPVTVGHGDVPDLADALAAALEGRPGILGIDRYVVGPVVGAHAGPGSFGASYLAAG